MEKIDFWLQVQSFLVDNILRHPTRNSVNPTFNSACAHSTRVCLCNTERERERERELYMKLSGNRVLIHVNIILVDGLHDQLVTLRLHQRGDEGSQVQLWLEIKQQLIVYDLVSCLLGYWILWHLIPT